MELIIAVAIGFFSGAVGLAVGYHKGYNACNNELGEW